MIGGRKFLLSLDESTKLTENKQPKSKAIAAKQQQKAKKQSDLQ
jgi:hypothetical protein